MPFDHRAVGVLVAAGVVLLILYLGLLERILRGDCWWFRIEFVTGLMPPTVVDRVQNIRIKEWLASFGIPRLTRGFRRLGLWRA